MMDKIKLVVEGMYCIKCETKVEHALSLWYAQHMGLDTSTLIRDEQAVLDEDVFVARASAQFGAVRILCPQAEQLRDEFVRVIADCGFVVR